MNIVTKKKTNNLKYSNLFLKEIRLFISVRFKGAHL